MIQNQFGIYVHVPFCAQKCPYCDFYSGKGSEEDKEAYTRKMEQVLQQSGARLNRNADTLYFGGGTPSLLGAQRMVRLVQAARQAWGLHPAEITVEVNPGEYQPGFFEALLEAGVNRLSMGLQSADPEELQLLGRRHTVEQAGQAVREAKAAGFTNISLDLMLAVQRQTEESLCRSIQFCADCGVQHISAYLLKIEEGTPYYEHRLNLQLPTEDESAALYLLACQQLEKLGFQQYEVSNFAVPGFESRHNLKYWNAQEYLGIGPSAHSFIDGKRFYCHEDLQEFLDSPRQICEGEGGSFEEYAMLRLRLCEGLRQKDCLERFGHPIPPEYIKRAKRFCDKGWVKCDETFISLTPVGFLLSNSLIAEILLG